MPLFEAIEAEVTAFFVSQGSVIDLLLKSVLERVASVESRVQVLRADLTSNLQSVRQQLLNVNSGGGGRVDVPAAVVDAQALAEAARTAAASAVASLSADRAAERQAADERAMALATQLNTVLELVFCPHLTGPAAVLATRAKQAALLGVADVLRDNERILSELGALSPSDGRGDSSTDTAVCQATDDKSSAVAGDPAVEQPNQTPGGPASRDAEAAGPAETDAAEGDAPELTPIREEHDAPEMRLQMQPDGGSAATGADHKSDGERGGEDHPTARGEATAAVAVVNNEDSTETESRQPEQPERRGGRASIQRARPTERMGRKKSVYHAYQDLQQAEEARLRELRERDDALLATVRGMLEQMARQTSPHQDDDQQLRLLVQELVADGERARNETGELVRELAERGERQRREVDDALALHRQQLDELQRRLGSEREAASRQLEEQRRREEEGGAERDARLQSLEQQLQDATAQLVAMLEAQAQEVSAAAAALGARLEGQFVTAKELDERHAQWQRTATSNCVFGATPATLAELQRALDGFYATRASSAPESDANSDASSNDALDLALDGLAQTLEDVLEIAGGDGDAAYVPLSPDGLRVMKALRVQLGKASDLARREQQASAAGHGPGREPEHDGGDGAGPERLAAALQRMELGTASLLDGCDAQFTRYQEALRAHQGAIAQLQQQFQQQTQSETALRARLALCPSQEDTQRLLQALQDKMAEMTSDSASQTAATLAELRAKLTDLPSHELLQRLALDLRGKADRAEMERLRSLLETQSAVGSPGPAASLTKAPLRCLSCDQSLFSLPASPSSRPGSPSAPSRPPDYSCACHNCGHASARPQVARDDRLLESDGSGDRVGARGWSSPALAASSATAAGAADDGDDITDDLFAVAAAARQRRLHEQQQLHVRSSAASHGHATRAATAGARRAFVNLDDGRNRIPLRRPVLADHIVYGPSIAPHALRKRLTAPSDPSESRAAVGTERRMPGGHVIARASASSALVRPFAELERGDDRPARHLQVPVLQQQPQRQQRSDRGTARQAAALGRE